MEETLLEVHGHLEEVQYQLQGFSSGAVSLCFQDTSVFPLPRVCETAVTSALCAESAENTRLRCIFVLTFKRGETELESTYRIRD